jgi:thioredoxin reductase (NADPH)
MHDVLVIGAGPAGISAALWCEELGLDILVLEQAAQVGGQLLQVHNRITNYPGAEFSNGAQFAQKLSAQMDSAEHDLWTGVAIDKLDLRAKKVRLKTGEELDSISIVLATGVRRRELGIPGEKEFAGYGIIESGVRDAERLAGKDVCIIGGGDAAAENALLLSQHCATVTLVHRGKRLKARPEFTSKVQTNHCVTTFTESVVTRILGHNRVEAVEIHRFGGIQPFQMAVQGVLVRIGMEPNTELFRSQLDLDQKGYILVNSQQETSVPNVFAVGDVSNPLAPTIAGAVGSGSTAAKIISSRLSNQ